MPTILAYLWDPTQSSARILDTLLAFRWFMLAPFVLGAILLLISCVLFMRLSIVATRKCRQVFNAIDFTSPSFKQARWHTYILWMVGGVGMVSMLAWEYLSEDTPFRYYSAEPRRLLLPIALAGAVGVFLLIADRVSRWIFRR